MNYYGTLDCQKLPSVLWLKCKRWVPEYLLFLTVPITLDIKQKTYEKRFRFSFIFEWKKMIGFKVKNTTRKSCFTTKVVHWPQEVKEIRVIIWEAKRNKDNIVATQAERCNVKLKEDIYHDIHLGFVWVMLDVFVSLSWATNFLRYFYNTGRHLYNVRVFSPLWVLKLVR